MAKRKTILIVAALALAGVAGMNMNGSPTALSTRPAVTAKARPTRTPRATPTPTPTKTPKPTVFKQDYVLNNETKIFHYPSCYHAGRIRRSRNRRQEVKTTREKLIASGYSPCGNCNP